MTFLININLKQIKFQKHLQMRQGDMDMDMRYGECVVVKMTNYP